VDESSSSNLLLEITVALQPSLESHWFALVEVLAAKQL